jgi:hypothetical protein
VLVPVAEAVTPGEAGGLAGAESVPLADAAELGGVAGVLAGLEAAAAELLDELQAVTSKAAQASALQLAVCRVLRAFVVNMDFHPSISLSGSVSQLAHRTCAAPPWLGQLTRGGDHGPFGINITGRAGYGRLRDRTDPGDGQRDRVQRHQRQQPELRVVVVHRVGQEVQQVPRPG